MSPQDTVAECELRPPDPTTADGYTQFAAATGPALLLDGAVIVAANDHWIATWGYGETEVVGNTTDLLQGPETTTPEQHKLQQAYLTRVPITINLINYTCAGRPVKAIVKMIPVGKTGFIQYSETADASPHELSQQSPSR